MAEAAGEDESALITKSGRRLDADQEQVLADEAESGFDPAVLIRRPI